MLARGSLRDKRAIPFIQMSVSLPRAAKKIEMATQY